MEERQELNEQNANLAAVHARLAQALDLALRPQGAHILLRATRNKSHAKVALLLAAILLHEQKPWYCRRKPSNTKGPLTPSARMKETS